MPNISYIPSIRRHHKKCQTLLLRLSNVVIRFGRFHVEQGDALWDTENEFRVQRAAGETAQALMQHFSRQVKYGLGNLFYRTGWSARLTDTGLSIFSSVQNLTNTKHIVHTVDCVDENHTIEDIIGAFETWALEQPSNEGGSQRRSSLLKPSPWDSK